MSLKKKFRNMFLVRYLISEMHCIESWVMPKILNDEQAVKKEYKKQLSMSKGYALYDQERDKEYREVAHRADDAMYADKAEYYKGHDRRRR